MGDGSMIQIRDVSKRYGNLQALNKVSLDVARGEVLMIIGPSGSGKSTLLRCINHLEVPDTGSVIVDGIEVNERRGNINAVRAEVGMVFQRFELFPHLTVLDNICLAQRLVRKRPEAERVQVARQLLKRVGIPEKEQSFQASCQADSNSVWRSPVRSRCSPKLCCSTSRPRRSTPR